MKTTTKKLELLTIQKINVENAGANLFLIHTKFNEMENAQTVGLTPQNYEPFNLLIRQYFVKHGVNKIRGEASKLTDQEIKERNEAALKIAKLCLRKNEKNPSKYFIQISENANLYNL